MAEAARLRQQADFQGADRSGFAPDSLVLMRPSDHLVPAAVRQFCTIGDFEGERYAECARDHSVVFDAHESEVEIMIEKRRRKVKTSSRIMQHVLRPERRPKIERKDPGYQVRPLPKREDLQRHRLPSSVMVMSPSCAIPWPNSTRVGLAQNPYSASTSGLEHDRPVGLILRKHPGLFHRCGLPFLPGGEPHHRFHIGPRARPHVDRVGRKARNHGCVHGVRGPECAEQERAARSEPGATLRPHRVDAMNVRGGLRAQLALLDRAPENHRAFAAQRHETGVHLGGDDARMGARLGIVRPKLCVRKFFGEIFEDRQRFPDMNLAVGERRHLSRRRGFCNGPLELRVVQRDHPFLEGNTRSLHGDPGPERPRRIVLVADDEFHQGPRPAADTHDDITEARRSTNKSLRSNASIRGMFAADHAFGASGASTGPPAFFQAPKPPAMCATGLSPMCCAVCVASAERQPPLQKKTKRLSAANTGLWYGPCGSTQHSSMPRGQWKAPGTRPSRLSSRTSRRSTNTTSSRPCSLIASSMPSVSISRCAAHTSARYPVVMFCAMATSLGPLHIATGPAAQALSAETPGEIPAM